MRLWVRPDQLAKLNITVTEIVNAITPRTRSIRRVNLAVNQPREPAIHIFRSRAKAV